MFRRRLGKDNVLDKPTEKDVGVNAKPDSEIYLACTVSCSRLHVSQWQLPRIQNIQVCRIANMEPTNSRPMNF